MLMPCVFPLHLRTFLRTHPFLLRCMLHHAVHTQEPSLTVRATTLQATLDALVESSQGDMRLMLGQLQMHRLRAKTLSFDQVRAASVKDMDKSPFDCARRLLSGESAQWSMMDRMDAVFQDLDLVPLLIQVRAICAHSAKSVRKRRVIYGVTPCPARGHRAPAVLACISSIRSSKAPCDVVKAPVVAGRVQKCS